MLLYFLLPVNYKFVSRIAYRVSREEKELEKKEDKKTKAINILFSFLLLH
ncbi:unnamed protein product [marine sediment metagenome]|uniref:Uncharacterized protein n=1 Tax=marine sediment metagenome TaxID=412755 RepID=X1GU49_9ZZZZ